MTPGCASAITSATTTGPAPHSGMKSLILMSKNAAFTAGDVGFLIGASTSAYCPEFNNRH